MKKLLIIHTGGTISMERDSDGNVVETKEHPLQHTIEADGSSLYVDELNIFQIPSPHITFDHMILLKDTILENSDKYDGFVITHGTDTMEETAYFIDSTVSISKAIVFTGAMRSSNETGADGPYNLRSALHVAAHEQAQNQGVLVVMNDQIHQARYVTKRSASSVDAFESVNVGPIGTVLQQNVTFLGHVTKQSTLPVSKISKKVLLFKAYVGMTEELFAGIHHSTVDGIVIEALGQGNLPPAVVPAIEKMVKGGLPVIITTRCPEGFVIPTYNYTGGGVDLKGKGVIFATQLNGPKARIQLLLQLENNATKLELEQAFQS